MISNLKNGLQNSHFVAKWFPNFQMATKWSSSFKIATKMLQASKWATKFPFGCEMFSQPHSYPLWNSPWVAKMCLFLFNGLQKCFSFSLWLQDDLQDTKWSPGYKNDLQNEERFTKTPCKAKGNCENANKASHHASKEESPLTEITRMKPFTPFLTS